MIKQQFFVNRTAISFVVSLQKICYITIKQSIMRDVYTVIEADFETGRNEN